MGRHAQQSKRGSDRAAQAGLPVGPAFELWILQIDLTDCFATWQTDDPQPYDYWQSRWRRPAISMLWTMGPAGVLGTGDGVQSIGPWPSDGVHQQDCEVMGCDVTGHPLTQWSSWQSLDVPI